MADPPITPASVLGRVMARARIWLAAHVPTREALLANRWLRPFAEQLGAEELWRFNRRSVPRGVALGVFVAILVPFMHMLVAALCAVLARANVIVAVVATWISNPFTLIGIVLVGYRIGHFLLHDVGLAFALRRVGLISAHHAHYRHFGPRVQMGLATGIGLVVEATVLAAMAYAASSLIWRLRVARLRARSERERAARAV